MRVYIIKDSELEQLRRNLELAQFREIEQRHGEHKEIVHDIHRRFNYLIEHWLSEIQRGDKGQ